MSGKTGGQRAYEPWRAGWMAFIAVADPDRELSELAEGDEVDPQWRAAWQAAAAAVETEQVRLAREDRDQLRKRMLDLAVHLEDDAATDTRIAETHPNGTSSLLLEERAEAKRHAADQIRKALDL